MICKMIFYDSVIFPYELEMAMTLFIAIFLSRLLEKKKRLNKSKKLILTIKKSFVLVMSLFVHILFSGEILRHHCTYKSSFL